MSETGDSLVREVEGESMDFSGAKRSSSQVTPSDLSEAIRRGWKINPKRKARYFKAMDQAIAEMPLLETPRERANVAIGCNRVLQAEQSAALRDLHHTEDQEHQRAMQRERLQHEDGVLDLRARRAEEGKPNDSILVQLAPVERLPEPQWMLAKRRKLLEAGEN